MAKQQLLWRRMPPVVKPEPMQVLAVAGPGLKRALEIARKQIAQKPKRPKTPQKQTSAPSLDEGFRDLRACVAQVGQGRMGPIQRKAGHLIISLRAADDELYFLRVATRNYVVEPPSCTFVDANGDKIPSAWPAYESSGPFRPPTFICTPPTAEFYSYHDERTYNPKDGTLVNAVCTIFAALNGTTYRGRFEKRQGRRGNRRRRAGI